MKYEFPFSRPLSHSHSHRLPWNHVNLAWKNWKIKKKNPRKEKELGEDGESGSDSNLWSCARKYVCSFIEIIACEACRCISYHWYTKIDSFTHHVTKRMIFSVFAIHTRANSMLHSPETWIWNLKVKRSTGQKSAKRRGVRNKKEWKGKGKKERRWRRWWWRLRRRRWRRLHERNICTSVVLCIWSGISHNSARIFVTLFSLARSKYCTHTAVHNLFYRYPDPPTIVGYLYIPEDKSGQGQCQSNANIVFMPECDVYHFPHRNGSRRPSNWTL